MRRLLAGAMLGAGLALVTLALAQPARGRHAPAKPKSAATGGSDNPHGEKGAPASSAASASTAQWPKIADAGPVPPPPEAAASGGALSPLNPAPAEFSDGGVPPTTVDYDRLLADIAALRARVATVSDTLFHSRIAVSVETSGDHGRIAAFSVTLDDGVVWTSPASFRADDATVVYDHAVAPGHHAVGVEIERRDDRDDTFRSIQRSRFVVDVPSDQRLAVDVKLSDDSSMGGDFRADHKGQYDLRVRLRAKAEPLGR